MGNQTTSVEKDLCCNLISALSLINMTVIHSFLRMLHLKCYTTFGAVVWFKAQYHWSRLKYTNNYWMECLEITCIKDLRLIYLLFYNTGLYKDMGGQ